MQKILFVIGSLFLLISPLFWWYLHSLNFPVCSALDFAYCEILFDDTGRTFIHPTLSAISIAVGILGLILILSAVKLMTNGTKKIRKIQAAELSKMFKFLSIFTIIIALLTIPLIHFSDQRLCNSLSCMFVGLENYIYTLIVLTVYFFIALSAFIAASSKTKFDKYKN